MTVIVLVVLVISACIFILINDKKSRKQKETITLYVDMVYKYAELKRASDWELRSLLPFFQDVDKRCARDCPDMNFPSLSLKIKNILNNEESIRD